MGKQDDCMTATFFLGSRRGYEQITLLSSISDRFQVLSFFFSRCFCSAQRRNAQSNTHQLELNKSKSQGMKECGPKTFAIWSWRETKNNKKNPKHRTQNRLHSTDGYPGLLTRLMSQSEKPLNGEIRSTRRHVAVRFCTKITCVNIKTVTEIFYWASAGENIGTGELGIKSNNTWGKKRNTKTAPAVETFSCFWPGE